MSQNGKQIERLDGQNSFEKNGSKVDKKLVEIWMKLDLNA